MGISHRYPVEYGDWENAFLSGNGKMGIMVFGNPLQETVVYNDRGFNLAKTSDRSFAQVSAADLAAIKDFCVAGNFTAANDLAVKSAHYQGGGEGNRHPGYEMRISTPEDGAIRSYSRICNFQTGEIVVRWTDRRGDWSRRAFVSRPDNVTAQSLTAPKGHKITCAIQLTTEPKMGFPSDMTFDSAASLDTLNMRVKYSPNPSNAGYEGVTRVVTVGGSKSVDGNVLRIVDADSVLLLTRTAKYYENCEAHWDRREIQKQLAALPADYQTLLERHKAVHQAIYDRVRLDLNASPADRARTNEEQLALQKTSPSATRALWERIFDAGRYYYLCASSDQTPPDLLGIWTADCGAGWGGFYHLDANLNFQVSGGNIGDMPEAMEGYFKINESWRPDFETNARKLLGCRGMVAAGNTPAAGAGLMAGISDYYPYQYATGEEGWLLYPFWEHYLVTGDSRFLRTRLYPLLKEMGDFYEDFLTKTDANGKYILAGSVSPENQPANVHVSLLNNSSFDIAGAKFALTALVETCGILHVEQGAGQGRERWTKILNKLPPYLVNVDGALQEWSWPGLQDNYNHRHSSQLLGVWPFREITAETEPAMFQAASTTLAKKDQFDYGTGHGYLHSALIAAAVNNDRAVNSKLLHLFQNGFYFDSLATSHNANHDVFCTDVCNAVPTVMMEMLISSRPGVLELLPALPETLDQGEISGVKGRNRVTIQSLRWDADGAAVTCVLKSDIDQDLTLIDRGGIQAISGAPKFRVSPLGRIARIVPLRAGKSVRIALRLDRLRASAEAASPAPRSRTQISVSRSLEHITGSHDPY
ncbi:lectin [Capsulimonas corticalis]|uniref:Lectin n=1 Tax=Capsulimonas corticalis TaxID=2219043 RepID=A0A402CUP5_9BACT|nr:glycoside hydrolase N-terminal domain-containing protein [Capsulimonas corticalis]BDI29049.1 lectin [Capsulimonas corticalis]